MHPWRSRLLAITWTKVTQNSSHLADFDLQSAHLFTHRAVINFQFEWWYIFPVGSDFTLYWKDRTRHRYKLTRLNPASPLCFPTTSVHHYQLQLFSPHFDTHLHPCVAPPGFATSDLGLGKSSSFSFLCRLAGLTARLPTRPRQNNHPSRGYAEKIKTS